MKPIELKGTIILDTETTGLGEDDEICEISAIDALTGVVLLDTLVKPKKPIPAEAIVIHGITNDMVEKAPPFEMVMDLLRRLTNGQKLVIYNADYDLRMIRQSNSNNSIIPKGQPTGEPNEVICAMNWYAEFYGEPNHRGDGYKWQSLKNAASQMNVDTSDIELHRAKADCEVTRRLIHHVNGRLQGSYSNEK